MGSSVYCFPFSLVLTGSGSGAGSLASHFIFAPSFAPLFFSKTPLTSIKDYSTAMRSVVVTSIIPYSIEKVEFSYIRTGIVCVKR